MPEEQGPCGYYTWLPVSREDIAWQVVSSHEFHQVVARHMYGVALRRVATSSEVEDQAYYVGAHGLREGAVRILKLAEFLNKSADPS